MLANLNGWHAAIIVLVILLLFGAPKIPALARSIGGTAPSPSWCRGFESRPRYNSRCFASGDPGRLVAG